MFSNFCHICYLIQNSQKQSGQDRNYLNFYMEIDTQERFSSVQSLSHVRLFVTPWTTARQASLSISNGQSPPKPMFIESVMPSNHLMLCHPLLFPPSIFPSIMVFSNQSALHIRWPAYWSFSFSIIPSNEYSDRFPLIWLVWFPCYPRDSQEPSPTP